MDAVHSLLSRQDELEGLLRALDLRVERFAERSLELIDQRHYAAKQSVHRKSASQPIKIGIYDELHKTRKWKLLLTSAV